MAFALNGRKFVRLCKHFHIRTCSSKANKNGLVIGVHSENGKITLTPSAEAYNSETNGKLVENLNLIDPNIKDGKCHIFYGLDKQFNAVAVVGVPKFCEKYDEIENIYSFKESVRVSAGAGCQALQGVGMKTICLESFNDAESAAEGGKLSMWKFQEYKSKKTDFPEVNLYNPCDLELNEIKWDHGSVKAESQNLARRLADTPGNLLTPSKFCDNVKNIFTPFQLETCARDRAWAEEKKMGAFLSVTNGSSEEPKFLEINYRNGCDDEKPYVFVGKGVTFDSGGISLKPSLNMDHMRADMGGAACVIGTLYAVAKLNLKINLTVLIPLCENMPSGKATKPGDVIYASNGKSICVDNTDAEGRLILADALCYAKEFNPEWILDIATLTGAMSVALGNKATGVFTNNTSLFSRLERAGSITGDRVWRFPLWKSYTKELTQFDGFDLNNIGKGKGGGSCTAAAFLREFVPKDTPWMHLDIASVMGPDSNISYLSKGMTGRPTRTLIELLQNQLKPC